MQRDSFSSKWLVNSQLLVSVIYIIFEQPFHTCEPIQAGDSILLWITAIDRTLAFTPLDR